MIIIKKSNAADTRTADKNTSFIEFSAANSSHINDVSRIMDMLADNLKERGKLHDHTKKETEKAQYNAFKNALLGKEEFSKSDWYKMHINSERHHLFSNCPLDVNLIDILEMISDITAAALARSGERVDDIAIPDKILKVALKNTIRLINDNIKLDE